MDILTASTRAATRDDLPFIFDSYWRSYIAYVGRPRSSGLQRLRDRLSLLWLRAKFIVACDPENPSHLLGWICTEGSVIHYVYVKSAYREQGLARTMIAAAGLASSDVLYATHWSPSAQAIAAKHELLRCICFDVPLTVEVFNDPAV